MKRIVPFACLAVLMIGAAAVWAQSTQPKPYKVVFDLTTDDPQDQAAVLRWLHEVASANPQSEMEVVMYGRGLALVMPGRSAMVDDVKQAISRPHVSFKVCEMSMRNQKVDKSALLPPSRPCRMASAKSSRDKKRAGVTSRPWPTEPPHTIDSRN